MSSEMSGSTEPYYVVDSPYEIAQWRPLAHWAMFIPHAIISNVLQTVARAVFVVYWFVLLFTGRLNPGLYGMLALYERYSSRTSSYLVGFSEKYPPFEFPMGPSDDDSYPPIRLNLPELPEAVSRKSLANFLLAIPHYIVIVFIAIAAAVVAIIAWFAVLFTGRWPEAMRDFLVRFTNYYYRVWAYVVMVENDYPKFGLPAA